MYQLTNVTQSYNGREVLSVPELAIGRGEILGVIGPSGAGKSTLLRLLNFLEYPTTGHLRFDGQPVTAALPLAQRRRVTMLFQRPVLFNRSVVANLGLGLALRGRELPPATAEQWLARLGLAELANHAAPTLSAGEAQRLALGRALLAQPDVLLLDEPTANLDPANVAAIEQLIQELQAEQGLTVVLVTHNLFQARRLAHRCGLLWGGKLLETAATEQFFTNPQKSETAAFVSGRLVY
ncbi:MAG: phosphate ABC transporter ATP-binding protein [Chloroflexi bacterium]|nr:phosphate ABC transporter ATP-binding protein [Chloroflexota bacterium]